MREWTASSRPPRGGAFAVGALAGVVKRRAPDPSKGAPKQAPRLRAFFRYFRHVPHEPPLGQLEKLQLRLEKFQLHDGRTKLRPRKSPRNRRWPEACFATGGPWSARAART